MGLGIDYALSADGDERTIRRRVEHLRQRALDLPFKAVGEIVEFRGRDAHPDSHDAGDPNHWLLCQGSRWRHKRGAPWGSIRIAPLHLIAFSTAPGDGAEQANFGLARYPKAVRFEMFPMAGLGGWSWRSWCKTQYASNPECGGVRNFLKCHLAVVQLLDQAAAMGLLHSARDDGKYWETRDLNRLASEVGAYNRLCAAVAGQMKDAVGVTVVSEIGKFPNFERIEAEARRGETPGAAAE
jgi:hypothetical protein